MSVVVVHFSFFNFFFYVRSMKNVQEFSVCHNHTWFLQ